MRVLTARHSARLLNSLSYQTRDSKESLLLGLPVPGIFVFKEEDSAKHVIADGQQRLKSLQFFYEGTFHERKFRLIDVHPRWRGKTFKELDAEDRQRLEDAIVHTTVFKQDNPSDKSSVYHVFRAPKSSTSSSATCGR
jgi:hypothetical protein